MSTQNVITQNVINGTYYILRRYYILRCYMGTIYGWLTTKWDIIPQQVIVPNLIKAALTDNIHAYCNQLLQTCDRNIELY
jgi:hypothetical protein